MILAKDEMLVKDWVYSEGVGVKSSLTITNKRIIATAKSSTKNQREEVLLRDVQGVSISHEKSSPSSYIGMIVAGSILCFLFIVFACSMVMAFSKEETMIAIILIAPLVLCFGLGLFFLAKGLAGMYKGTMTLLITMKGSQSVGITLGVVKHQNKTCGRMTVGVMKHKVVDEIIETIGSLILTDNN